MSGEPRLVNESSLTDYCRHLHKKSESAFTMQSIYNMLRRSFDNIEIKPEENYHACFCEFMCSKKINANYGTFLNGVIWKSEEVLSRS